MSIMPLTTTTTPSSSSPSSDNPSPSSSSITPFQPPRATRHAILQCQFSSWYATFGNNPSSSSSSKKRKNITIKSIIIQNLPNNFIPYLLSDGIRLPLGASKVSSFVPPDRENDNEDDGSWYSEDDEDDNQKNNNNNNQKENLNKQKQEEVPSEDDEEEEEEDDDQIVFSFPELNEQIQNAIELLGGQVLPKFNWSCPKDATWLNAGTMKCSTPGDVYLLLKGSDFVMHDVIHAFDHVVPVDDDGNGNDDDENREDDNDKKRKRYEIVLRKWCNLYPSMEFRCFVAHHQLVAISQRNHTQHFPHLSQDFMTIRLHLLDFFHDYIQYTFASKSVSNYTFDCYIDKSNRVWLIDFNVWAEQTDSLLFSWKELVDMALDQTKNHDEVNDDDIDDDVDNTLENKRPEIRIVNSPMEIQQDPLASYRAPIDTVDLAAADTLNGANLSFDDFVSMCERPSTR